MRIKSTILSSFLLFVLSSSVVAQIQVNQSKADSLLLTLVSEGYTQGVAAAMAIDGITAWIKADGTIDANGKVAHKTNTKNRTASIAKPITAVAVMQLVENGKLDLDAPIQTYLPDFPKSNLGDITTRHLLNQTSGIDAYQGKEAATQKEYSTLNDAMKVFSNRPLLFKPGTKYFYTTYGYVVLGAIIEKASGMDYGSYMQVNIFDPAGMTNSGIEKFGKKYENKSGIFHAKKKGKISIVKNVNNLSNRVPAGGFYSTAEDLLAFGDALLSGKLISEASMEDMFFDPGIRPKDAGNPYTKGWHIYGNSDKLGRVMGHSGGQYGASSQLMVLPKIKTVIVIMANTSGSLSHVRNHTIRLINCLIPAEK